MEDLSKLCANITTDMVEEQKKAVEAEKHQHTERKKGFDPNKYFDTQLKEGEDTRKVKIRILPVSVDNPNLYQKIDIHPMKVSRTVAASGFKTFTCLNDPTAPNHDPNVKCPLCTKASELYNEVDRLRKEGKGKEADTLKQEANQYLKKESYIVRLIDRSRENEGPKFWRIRKKQAEKDIRNMLIEIYNNLMDESKANGEEGYNVFDLQEGRDFTVTLKREPAKREGQKDSVSVHIMAESRNKPLSTDVEQANAWLKDSTRWQDLYAVRDAEYLSIIADKMIPWKDNSTGHYIPKTEEEVVTYKNRIVDNGAKEADHIIAQGAGDTGTSDELPF